MKQYKKYLSVVALITVGVLLAGCTGLEENQPQQEKNIVTLTTTVGFSGNESTKALSDGGVKTFAENDQIAFIYKNTNGETKVAGSQVLAAGDISADGKSATITVTFENPAENSQLRAIYPAAMLNAPIGTSTAIDDAGTIAYDNLNVQDGYLGSLGQYLDLAVFDGEMNGDQLPVSIALENKLAICAFTIKNSDGSEDLTSSITNLTVNDGTDTYTINRAPGVGPLYVAMKPVENANIELTATHDNGQHYTKSLTGKSYAANNIYQLGMRMAETYKTYGTLPVGTLLKLGDQIALSTNVHINSDPWVETSKAPFTLVRANVSGETVTEAADGTHYVLKDKDGGFHLQENNFLVSEATDGLIVANYNEPNNSFICCTHVNLAEIDISKLPVDNSWNAKYYTAHTYECLYGTLDGDVLLRIQSDAAVWLGGMTHHAGEYVSGIVCLGSARINLVEGTTNDLTRGHTDAYNGIYIDNGTLTIAGTGTLLASGGFNYAGIGGYDSGADIVIDGGNITATGGLSAAGIGSDHDDYFGNITIKGGNVTATGGSNAAGIGCGFCGGGYSSCGDITFNGGTVVVNAGEDGWGVGLNNGGNYNCGDITFVGGSVTVKGNIATTSEYGKSIYVDGVYKGDQIIASSSNPFVYPEPATP